MECAAAHECLSPRLDGELTPDVAEALRAHLETCATCRTEAAQLAALDQLLRAQVPDHDAAGRVRARALRSVDTPLLRPPAGGVNRRPSTLLATIAATAAVAACVLVLIWRPNSGVPGPGSNLVEITLAKGTVNVLSPASKEWEAIELPQQALQPVGFQLQTEAMSLCEFRCPSGGVVRVDEQTELRVVESTHVAVSKGRIWCSAPAGSEFTVAPSPPPAPDLSLSFTCRPASEMDTTIDLPKTVRVIAARGPVQLVGQQTMTLQSGQLVRFSTGEWEEPVPVDALQMTEWMLPLLALRGGHDREFSGHVTALLSRIGNTKLDYVREEQLVDLGEPAAIPLIAYLRDPDATPDPARRARAARIIAKTAPLESLPDLVELLNDLLGPVRVGAAQALHRLTGLDQGVSVEEWNAGGESQKAGVARWREWLRRRA